MKQTLTLLLTFTIALCNAQTYITTCDFHQQGEQIIIEYNLEGQEGDNYYQVSLNVYEDGMLLYPKSLSGSIGTVSSSGQQRIIWDALKDLSRIDGNLQIELTADLYGYVSPDPVPKSMVLVEGGTFMMGCTSEQGDDCQEDEKPAHEVYLDDFYIDKHEVTNEQYCRFLNAKGNQTEGGKTWLDINAGDCKIQKKGSHYSTKAGYAQHPVVEVTWYGARAYCQWRSETEGGKFSLPTEAQWEYAARGGQKSRGYKYSGSNKLDVVAWYHSNADGKTHRAGEKRANELGIYDMSGNVWEWCNDWYDKGYYKEKKRNNPSGPIIGKYIVLRGGSWLVNPLNVRVSNRYNYFSFLNVSTNVYGFRCSRTK